MIFWMTFHRDPVEERDDRSEQYRSCPFSARAAAQASNIYAREPHAFDEDSRTAATRFGPYAAVAACNLHAYQSARDMVANLQTALETRGVIDQAKGILMDRHKLTAD